MSSDSHHLIATGINIISVASDAPTLTVRVNQAIPYLMGAARYSRLVGEIESANAQASFGPFWDEMRDHAVAAIFFADAALESYANELFADGRHVFPAEFVPGLDLLWSELERRKSTLDKLDLALSLRNKPKLDRKSRILKSVNALARLRNEMTHFKPEWSNELDKHLTISAALQGFFQPNRWFSGQQIFPNGWIGHSCTKWAVETAVEFLKHFELQADLPERTRWDDWHARLVA
ncbi:hypothetical protein [Rhodopseudomonas palustris]|uniref:hypothetical protein n=1 Tax=Rhodopseudomonas palustris TaxID=1076 RepID=UPI001058CA22|nr:hypothetical protein [Rhodopseudomonas palustris]QLH71132.1 hypothetical protein HZF03_10190 [Rhodopseudomonas palustris]